MKKFMQFCMAAMVLVVFAACNTNEPNKRIIGTWSEPYHVTGFVKSFSFLEDGSLIYKNIPDTTRFAVPGYSGEFAKLRYSLTDDGKLCISGEGVKYSSASPQRDTVPFTYLTDFVLSGGTLTIDSFSYDGGIDTRFYKRIIVYKQ